jgi:hypothetical protein
VPTISRFYGILIRMYARDHAPPHFHARYAGDEVVLAIDDGRVLEGGISERALRLVQEWLVMHRDELSENWHRTQVPEQPLPIDPLA